MLGLKVHEKFSPFVKFGKNERPIVFISHMEHHSNHTTWLETIADLEIINPDTEGLIDLKPP